MHQQLTFRNDKYCTLDICRLDNYQPIIVSEGKSKCCKLVKPLISGQCLAEMIMYTSISDTE